MSLVLPPTCSTGAIVSTNIFEVKLFSVTFRNPSSVSTYIANVAFASNGSDGTVKLAIMTLLFTDTFGSDPRICAVYELIVSFTTRCTVNVSPAFAYTVPFVLLLVMFKLVMLIGSASFTMIVLFAILPALPA